MNADFQVMNDSILHAIAFSQLQGINDYQRNILLKKFGAAKDIYRARQKGVAAFSGIEKLNPLPIMEAWPFNAAGIELERMQKLNIDANCLEEAIYPNRLYECEDAPIVLFSKGSKKWNLPHLVSIIGTRNHTAYAYKVIQELLEGIAHLNLGVVSGLALGIDGMVHHKACQLKIPNWGVMATGLDQIYPAQHRGLVHKIMENGGILSENTTETSPLPFQFPKRNRIVAGMTDATIVIESAVQGGSMITASLARSYHREVFAVPGKIFDAKSKGCLALIQSNTAQLYQNPSKLLENLGWQLAESKLMDQKTPLVTLSPLSQAILDVIAKESPIHRDAIAKRFSLNIGLLSTLLLNLELNGLILPHGGAFYSIL